MTLRRPQVSQPPRRNPPADPNPAAVAPKRIRIVDDDPSVRKMLGRVLSNEGYRVDEAANGAHALEIVAAGQFDLMLLDLNMPRKNGWETFERLTSQHPWLPVIIITARPNQLFMSAGAGASALMEKPLDFPKLLETISVLLVEDPAEQIARNAGRLAAFYYHPVKTKGEPNDKGRFDHPMEGNPA